jgi:hypothetical protein
MMQDACTKYGARSVSEFARTAIQKAIGESVPPTTMEDDVRDLRAKVEFLSEEIARIAAPHRPGNGRS